MKEIPYTAAPLVGTDRWTKKQLAAASFWQSGRESVLRSAQRGERRLYPVDGVFPVRTASRLPVRAPRTGPRAAGVHALFGSGVGRPEPGTARTLGNAGHAGTVSACLYFCVGKRCVSKNLPCLPERTGMTDTPFRITKHTRCGLVSGLQRVCFVIQVPMLTETAHPRAGTPRGAPGQPRAAWGIAACTARLHRGSVYGTRSRPAG